MNCPNCGTSNLDNASICVNCGRPLHYAPPPPSPPPPPGAHSYTPPAPPRPSFGAPYTPGGPIPNYLVQAILVTFCCCMPLGIVAIIFAAQVSSKQSAGDYAGAVEASANARKWCWIGFWSGLIINIVLAVIYGAAGFFQAFNQ